jgi:hypothetical protein
MINPLAIPELVAKVVENLNIKELAVISALSKTWRLEAQRKLYQNRSTIIYGFFKPYLNDLRLRSLDLSADLLSVIPFQEFNRFRIFRGALGLDIKTELLAIRKQFREAHKRLKKICKGLDKEVIKRLSLMRAYEPYSKEYWVARRNHDEVYKKYLTAGEHQFENWKNMINFEYFLTRFAGTRVLTEDEIDIIIDKLQPLRDEEEERRWAESANSILEYWGDEDPDLV